MPRNHLDLGNWNAVCDVCGQKYKASQLRKRWDGLMVCSHDWEQRHPQDFLRVPHDNPAVPWARPEADIFAVFCPYPTYYAMADIGTADCAQAGTSNNNLICVSNSAVAGMAITGCAVAGSL